MTQDVILDVKNIKTVFWACFIFEVLGILAFQHFELLNEITKKWK